MPSTNKTPNLGLNNWVGTDKPTREDFNKDNLKIDDFTTAIGDTDLLAKKPSADATIWGDWNYIVESGVFDPKFHTNNGTVVPWTTCTATYKKVDGWIDIKVVATIAMSVFKDLSFSYAYLTGFPALPASGSANCILDKTLFVPTVFTSLGFYAPPIVSIIAAQAMGLIACSSWGIGSSFFDKTKTDFSISFEGSYKTVEG